MRKLYCDDCGDELNVNWTRFNTSFEDKKNERSTQVSLEINGQDYDTDDGHTPKKYPIKHICKKCSIKFFKKAIKVLEKEYDWIEDWIEQDESR